MRRVVAFLCLVLPGTAHAETPLPAILEGDIIFQTSRSSQSLAIQRATKSQYSHMGIIFREGDETLVYEAVQPVRKTPLAAWIKRGAGGKIRAQAAQGAHADTDAANPRKNEGHRRKPLGKGI